MKNKILEEKNLQSLNQVEFMKNFLPNREKLKIEITSKNSEKNIRTNKKMNFEFHTVNFTKLMKANSEIKNIEKFYSQKYENLSFNMMNQIEKIKKTFNDLQKNDVIY